ncbi:hypothetical protein, partial [Spirosoma endophyticum]
VPFRLSNVPFRPRIYVKINYLQPLQIEQIIQVHKICVEKKAVFREATANQKKLPQTEYERGKGKAEKNKNTKRHNREKGVNYKFS